eukprot:Skav232072  [mRNA]  locus=scaffold1176:419322:430651:- [translate_table: standard]
MACRMMDASGVQKAAAAFVALLLVIVGNGCFWHTQYDFVLVEQDANGTFRRNDAGVTSLIGYAGGRFESPSGAVCYHGLPHSDYSRLGAAGLWLIGCWMVHR